MDLNRYFYDALRQTLSLSDTTFITNHTIWFYEIPWTDHKVTRPGYLFFGIPDERTTAQPPRDFYMYFLPPFLDRSYDDQQRSDEVIFQLTQLEDKFESTLRTYAGARWLATTSTDHRQEYAAKATQSFQVLNRWLHENFTSKYQVIHQGKAFTIQNILAQSRSSASQNFEDLIRVVASTLINPEFTDRYPRYPKFTKVTSMITEASRANSATEALRKLSNRPSQLGANVLSALGLLDDKDELRPERSPYADHFIKLLNSKPAGHVVNRDEIIHLIAQGINKVEKDPAFQLEPEWVVVILFALVYHGDIVVNLDGKEEIDASAFDKTLTRGMDVLTNFRNYHKPRDLPTGTWASIFELLGLAPGIIRDPNTRETAVLELQKKVESELNDLIDTQHRIERGVTIFNTPLFTDRVTFETAQGHVEGSNAPANALYQSEFLAAFRGYKLFLEDLRKYNSVGKLNNLKTSPSELTDTAEHQRTTRLAKRLLAEVAELQPLSGYLAEALNNLPANHAWRQRCADLQTQVIDQLRLFGKNKAPFDPTQTERQLVELKKEYISIYADFHKKLTLNAAADQKRSQLYDDQRNTTLKQVSGITLLSSTEYEQWVGSVTRLLVCKEFYEGRLEDTPTCPSCHLHPNTTPHIINAQEQLNSFDAKLSDLVSNALNALRENLASEIARQSLASMTPAEVAPIQAFLQQPVDAVTIPNGLIASAEKALAGIQAISLSLQDLHTALSAGGMPASSEELQQRFHRFIENARRSGSGKQIRFHIDKEG